MGGWSGHDFGWSGHDFGWSGHDFFAFFVFFHALSAAVNPKKVTNVYKSNRNLTEGNISSTQ